jgi:hypothetical protein
MDFQIPVVIPFVKTQSLKILHIRKTGSVWKRLVQAKRALGEEQQSRKRETESDDGSVEDYATSRISGASDSYTMPPSHDRQESKSLFEPALNKGNPPTDDGCLDSYESSEEATIIDMLENEHILVEFANWVFGSEGIRSLEVLAVGDFSFDGRYEKFGNHLLCKHSGSIRNPEKDLPYSDEVPADLSLMFRPLRKTDEDVWDLVNANMDFLGACPVDQIMED